MANALPLLCPDGAVGVAVAARDEAVQLRPLDERHHQGGGAQAGGEASIMTNHQAVAAVVATDRRRCSLCSFPLCRAYGGGKFKPRVHL